MVMIDDEIVLKGRRDLVWQSQSAGWLVYDPLVRSGYRCGQAERWLFEQFDGCKTLADIHRAAAIHADVQIIAWHEVATLAETLIRRGLVRQVALNGNSSIDNLATTRTWTQWFSQSVSWRLRGVNPQRGLQWLAPRTDLFFSATAVRVWIGLMLVVLLLVLADFERLFDQAHLWEWIIKPSSGSMLFVIFVVTRAIHELGHALILTRFGGRSPDIGVIFMLGAPCVYCDVTESWRLPYAWQRAAVAAGGMLAESMVATLAAIVWLMTVERAVNTLALQTMVVCSISTWLVNANPLMRFDGYYILSDWCDEPNLRLRADECAMRWLKRLVLGRINDQPIALSSRRFAGLVVFSLLGFIYRISLSWMMASVIVAMYAAWHFETVGKWIAIALLACWWGIPAMKLMNQLMRSARTVWAKTRLSLLVAWAALLICIVPIPSRECAQGWVQPVSMQGLYAPLNAKLEEVKKFPGERVKLGDVVFQLNDQASQTRRIEYQRQKDSADIQVASVDNQSKRGEPTELDPDAVKISARNWEKQAEYADVAISRMSVKADMPGKLISLPASPVHDIDGKRIVSAPLLWLDTDQYGRVVPQGTMVAAVCSREQLAVIPLQDAQLHDICEGTAVRFYVPSHSDRVWNGRVEAIVRLEQLDSLSRLAAAQAAQTDANGMQLSAKAKDRAGYAAVINLPMQDACINSEVHAVFTVPAKTLAARANDWAHNNLRWLID